MDYDQQPATKGDLRIVQSNILKAVANIYDGIPVNGGQEAALMAAGHVAVTADQKELKLQGHKGGRRRRRKKRTKKRRKKRTRKRRKSRRRKRRKSRRRKRR